MIISMRYGSHLPVLMKVVKMTDGPILELGIGIYSTIFLHWACYATKRELISYESDKGYARYFDSYNNSFHKVIFVEDWDKVKVERMWDLVLVDHVNPRRKIEAKRVANYAKYVILHDTEPKVDNDYKYSEIYPFYKYRFDFKEIIPNTTLVSNFIDLKDFKI